MIAVKIWCATPVVYVIVFSIYCGNKKGLNARFVKRTVSNLLVIGPKMRFAKVRR